MKRVNLLEYFDLAEALHNARRATGAESNKGGNIYIGIFGLPPKLRAFNKDDNGFSACKHVAMELAERIEQWISENMTDPEGQFSADKFNRDYDSWQYSEIGRKIDAFRSVFEAECRDVDVYSVGQVSIYKTTALVSEGEGIIPAQYHDALPTGVLSEFNNAGRCLAFSLPTACGFHAFRGLELVMGEYLKSYGVTRKFSSWNDYIVAAQKLIDSDGEGDKPSAKVATMLDRMRELDRNPLMHPRNVLDETSADMLYRLAAITVVEMVKDMKIPRPALLTEGAVKSERALPTIKSKPAKSA